MTKIVILFVFILSSNIVFAQNESSSVPSNIRDTKDIANLGGFGYVNYSNKPKKIVGNVHVFEKWNTTGKLFIDDKIYKLSNINLNMKTNNFEVKFGKNNDSIFVFNNTVNFEYILINNKKFKNIYFKKKSANINVEVIYDGENLKLLKEYEVGVKHNDPDPAMIRKNLDNYFKIQTYYIKNGDEINRIGLRKKNILIVFGDKANVVAKFVKENKLSYKKEKDLYKIFTYYSSLQQ